jgi:hypothetical protein
MMPRRQKMKWSFADSNGSKIQIPIQPLFKIESPHRLSVHNLILLVLGGKTFSIKRHFKALKQIWQPVLNFFIGSKIEKFGATFSQFRDGPKQCLQSACWWLWQKNTVTKFAALKRVALKKLIN